VLLQQQQLQLLLTCWLQLQAKDLLQRFQQCIPVLDYQWVLDHCCKLLLLQCTCSTAAAAAAAGYGVLLLLLLLNLEPEGCFDAANRSV
jgi:hypothetical protein